MIVVSDTSPLNYLVLTESQHILPKLFKRILIPEAVRQELESAGAPDAIKQFLATEPDWLETHRVSEIDPRLRQLDAGERDAIALALSAAADRLLVDEKRARAVARDTGLAVAGTLAVLDLATCASMTTIRRSALRWCLFTATGHSTRIQPPTLLCCHGRQLKEVGADSTR